ncbi:cupin domain-containing protein [Luteimonas granuli]|uniref:Cupin domain-containing protein n=1 Tax=Luteimonas granuli TaxID=1176533 RepID=A0A518N3T0_9GAMM|nr:cupin domain-containing protein [Luteimonas granuli]QDW66558.1 cupin domain-containing protein [Luteimonas granuli]
MSRPTLLLISLLPILAFAQPVAEPAPVARTFQDPALDWGPCPAFMPEGCAIAVLQGDPSRNNADVFFKVPGKTDIPRHWHTSAEHMVLVSGKLHVTYDGHAATVLDVGTFAHGPAELPHKASCVSDEPCVLAIAFELPVDAFASDSDTPDDSDHDPDRDE